MSSNRCGLLLIHEPTFYLVAIPVVILLGFATAGFGGALGVPLRALVIARRP